MDNHRIGYKSYWLAYFDLLGFENRVKVMPAVYPILDEYHTVLAEMRRNPREIICKWFSDTFLFLTPDDSEQSCGGIMAACEFLFWRLTMSHIPVRGCLTVGDLYYEDAENDIVVGPALVEAYKLGEYQDWLGFVLSDDAVRRRDQYGLRRDYYREYDVPFDHSKSTKRLEAFVLSHRDGAFSPDWWWRCLHDMEHGALTYIKIKKRTNGEGQPGGASTESETERVLLKYQNSKKYLRSLYPQLADVVEGEYGPILRNKPEIKRKLREMDWRLK